MSWLKFEDQYLDQISFVVFDVETTGLEREARIVELAAVRLESWKPIDQIETLIQPGVSIPASATLVHGIDNNMVADAPTFHDIAPAWAYIIQDAVLIGHNIFSFDLRYMLRQMREVFGVGFHNWAVDTLIISRRLFPGKSHKLENLAALLQIPYDPHRAINDVYANAELWIQMARQLQLSGPKTLNDLARFSALRQLDGTGLPRYPSPPKVLLRPRT
jgi:DNA polymerase III epsilon subunit family exonuclease